MIYSSDSLIGFDLLDEKALIESSLLSPFGSSMIEANLALNPSFIYLILS